MEITITRINGGLSFIPSPPYLLKYLQYHHRGFKIVHYRKVPDYQLKLLYTTDATGLTTTLPGFYEKIVKLIEKNDDTAKTIDSRTQLPSIDWDAVKNINWGNIGATGFRDYQIGSLATFLTKAQTESGLIVAAAGSGKTILMAATYAAFNSLNTIIIIPLKEVFIQTYDKFSKLFPDLHIGRVGGGSHDISDRLTISTYKSFESCAVEKCQLLLADEVQSTTGEGISKAILASAPIRSFGYTATDKGMFNKADKLITGLFGERLIHMAYEESQNVGAVVPCTVYFINMPDNIMINSTTTEGKLSEGIDRCKTRNQLIGQTCKYIPEGWQTFIFVEHIETHLIPLHKMLPISTKFLHRNSDKASIGSYALNNKQQKQVMEDFKAGKFQYLLLTDCGKAGIDVPNCKVVIQASGGTSEVELIQEAGRGTRTHPGKTHFVLIDFMDNHDRTLQNMSLSRMETYRKQGWKIKTIENPKDIDWNDHENCVSTDRTTEV